MNLNVNGIGRIKPVENTPDETTTEITIDETILSPEEQAEIADDIAIYDITTNENEVALNALDEKFDKIQNDLQNQIEKNTLLQFNHDINNIDVSLVDTKSLAENLRGEFSNIPKELLNQLYTIENDINKILGTTKKLRDEVDQVFKYGDSILNKQEKPEIK